MRDNSSDPGTFMSSLARLARIQSRSISPENFNGEKGKGGMSVSGIAGVPPEMQPSRKLGQGWKVSPCILLDANSTTTLAEIKGPGAIKHIWLTCPPSLWRSLILRFYWDDEETPSIEVPLGDFFCNGWCVPGNVNSLAVTVNPAGGFNCYWEMPFRKKARITVENLLPVIVLPLFYQVDYVLTEVPEDAAYLHAQWRRSNPLPDKEVHTILDAVKGWGHYVGTYIAWKTSYNGWWGEGEVKFYLDGDREWPTICGTGTEDYFGGAFNFEFPKGQYAIFSTAYQGLSQVIKPDEIYQPSQCFGMYRWHIPDPVHFDENIRVTIQAMGWKSPEDDFNHYITLPDDIASTAFWYQQEPHAPFESSLLAKDLEVDTGEKYSFVPPPEKGDNT